MPPPAKTTPTPQIGTPPQGIATLCVMIVILTIIVMFCCFSAPGVRDLCKRYVFRTCVVDDPDRDNDATASDDTTPTLILLPNGRMLVVDRNVFHQLQTDGSGLNFLEFSANVIRNQQRFENSLPSILEASDTSKGMSPISLGVGPPAYEEIFGEKDPPPAYSQLSLTICSESVRNSDRRRDRIACSMGELHGGGRRGILLRESTL